MRTDRLNFGCLRTVSPEQYLHGNERSSSGADSSGSFERIDNTYRVNLKVRCKRGLLGRVFDGNGDLGANWFRSNFAELAALHFKDLQAHATR